MSDTPHITQEAAREMLAALRAAVRPLELYQAYGWSDRGRVIPKIRAAIARATGGEGV
ncbi:hypothetical protein UFOVP747_57 [uncultured Caudovirales phage]|uniref:Uncharacterized protein n=1 Tax=uncultured Caudovirales phage TaxID=2100421 RepID=A0A6J7X449_9CAUD|nr:hypothetical protein UFOVP675_42 [uncultured Caudovirales phage]CAB5225632.1 hypothetical protein UFOVP747_57 [uncultured Caudovirales phage]